MVKYFPTQRVFTVVYPKQGKVVFIMELLHLYLRSLKAKDSVKHLL